MSFSNLQRSTSDIYTEAESLIYKANNTPNSNTKSKLTLLLKAVSLLEHIQLSEKKEKYRDIYNQRMEEIKQQIKSIQLPLENLVPKIHNSIKSTPKLDSNTSKDSNMKNVNNPFSLYPTLPDFTLDENNQKPSIPTVNPIILNTDNFINQTQTQTNIPFQQVYPEQVYIKSQTQDFSAINQNNFNGNGFITPDVYYPPFLPPSYPDFNGDISYPDYPMSMPTVQPQVTDISYKPLSQPGPFSNNNNEYQIQKHESFSDSSNEKKRIKSETEIFKGNIMLISTDHADVDTESNAKSASSLVLEFNNNTNTNMNKYKVEEAKKKKKHGKSKSKPNVSDKIINIQENFKIESLLGHGTFGNIFLATEYSTNKKYIIKELKDFEENNETSVSFFREIEALSKADHPAVIHLYGFSLLISKEKRYPAIVTEYLPGGTLLDIINGMKTVTMTEKLILLYGMCEAMHYLHDKLHIVHRDLKPKNVLLNSNNEPIISDFGLSKVMSEKYMMRSQIIGSPKYMAPELLKDEEYSDKVDVYSYGIIAYELLTGKIAFGDVKSKKELRALVLSGKRPPLDDEKKLHPVFKNLIQSCWDENESLRPTFYDLAVKFRKMEFVVDDCDKIHFRKYVRKCVYRI